MASRTTITIVMGSTRCRAVAPAPASTTMMASGPYATDVRASSDRAERPSTGVMRSLAASEWRSGRPVSNCHPAAA
jgi:hypothetical protein